MYGNFAIILTKMRAGDMVDITSLAFSASVALTVFARAVCAGVLDFRGSSDSFAICINTVVLA